MAPKPNHPLLAATLDLAMRGLQRARERVVPDASGDVLEIGVGTGLNLPHYVRDRLTSFCGIEPDPHMLKRARRRAEELAFEGELSDAGAEALPYGDDSFDTVVCTFVLCTIPQVEAALGEMRRTLRPGGTLLFAEHVLAEGAGASRVQNAIDPLWGCFAGGCHLNRDALQLIRQAGFDDVEWHPMGRQSWSISPVIRGRACVAALP